MAVASPLVAEASAEVAVVVARAVELVDERLAVVVAVAAPAVASVAAPAVVAAVPEVVFAVVVVVEHSLKVPPARYVVASNSVSASRDSQNAAHAVVAADVGRLDIERKNHVKCHSLSLSRLSIYLHICCGIYNPALDKCAGFWEREKRHYCTRQIQNITQLTICS